MTPRKTLLAAATAAGLLVAVTACGSDDRSDDGSASEERDTTNDGDDGDGDDDGGGGGLDGLSGPELAERALDATLALESLAVSGEFTQHGESQAMTLRIAPDGACEGSMDMGGAEVEFLHVDDVSYVTFPAELAEQEGLYPEFVDEVVGDGWVVPPAGSGEQFSELCDHTALFPSDTDDVPEAEIVEGREIDGQATRGLRFEEDEAVLYVLDDSDAPYFVQIEEEGSGEFTFSDFNEDFDIQAPPPDEVLDMSELPME